MDDLISRQPAIDALDEIRHVLDKKEKELTIPPSVQPERLTDDDFETIRIHLNAHKEELCNQSRWKEAEEYQRIIDRFMSFASAQPEPQWIPCSERLPVDDDYRESMECLDGCVWYFTDKGSMGLGYYYYSTKEWSTLRDLKPDGKVIAWMPLPEPYQEGKGC